MGKINKSRRADKLWVGDVLALPFGKTATIRTIKFGTKFVTIATEHGTSRLENGSYHLIEVDEEE
jgi:hypothetical protein